jgi:uncharacterized protein (TIGR03083 family)
VTPAADPQVGRCLRAIRELSDLLVNEVRQLSAEAWEGPTNCPPWRVRDLVTHVVSSGEGFVDNISRGLAGSDDPPVTDAERQRHLGELAAASPRAVAEALDAVTSEFVHLYAGLTNEDLSKICYHRRGNRSVRWYAAHRLAEVAFHSWDLQFSLGQEPSLGDAVARLLLPTLLESNAPRTYAAGLSQQRGRGERFLLAVADELAARWLVTIQPDRLDVQPGDGPSDLAITARASDLALLVYGRASLASAHVTLEGDLSFADRFTLIFPRP